MKIKLLLVTLLLSVTAPFSAAQQQTEAASKVLALENKWNEAYSAFRATLDFLEAVPLGRLLV